VICEAGQRSLSFNRRLAAVMAFCGAHFTLRKA